MESQADEIMKSEKKARSPQIGEPVLVRWQPAPLDALDFWRSKQPDLPSRSEAIRRLVALALEAEANKKKGRAK
jgi:hypothetical protein